MAHRRPAVKGGINAIGQRPTTDKAPDSDPAERRQLVKGISHQWAVGPLPRTPPTATALYDGIGTGIQNSNRGRRMIQGTPNPLNVTITAHQLHGIRLAGAVCADILRQTVSGSGPFDIVPHSLQGAVTVRIDSVRKY